MRISTFLFSQIKQFSIIIIFWIFFKSLFSNTKNCLNTFWEISTTIYKTYNYYWAKALWGYEWLPGRNLSSAIWLEEGGDESYPGYEIPQHKQTNKLEVRQPFIPGFLPSILPSVRNISILPSVCNIFKRHEISAIGPEASWGGQETRGFSNLPEKFPNGGYDICPHILPEKFPNGV